MIKNINLTILFNLIFTISILANSEYRFNYELIIDNKKAGNLEFVCIKDKSNIYKYITKLNMKYKYIFMDYEYKYKQEAYVKNGVLLSIVVYEKDDDKVKKVKAKRDGDFLIYTNGKKIDMTQIDYLPFDYKSKSYENKITDKNFTLKTFDPLSGETYMEKNHISEDSNSDLIKIKTIGYKNNSEEKILLKDGTLINLKNKFFEANLIK